MKKSGVLAASCALILAVLSQAVMGVGFRGLGNFGGGLNFSVATDISNDGSVVVGYATMGYPYDPLLTGFRWERGQGPMVDIGDHHNSFAYGVSRRWISCSWKRTYSWLPY